MNNLIKYLETTDCEQEAIAKLAPLKVKELRALAKEAVVYVGKSNKQEIVERIVSSLITSRKRAAGIRGEW
jgi:hypothetical protein